MLEPVARTVFFLPKASVVDGLVKRCGEHANLCRNLRNVLPLVEQRLCLDQPLRGQLLPTPLLGRNEKRFGAPLAKRLAAALHCRDRYPESARNLTLGCCPIDDELRREESKATQVGRFVREHGQVSVEVHDLTVALLER